MEDLSMKSIKKKNRIAEINDNKNQLWNAIRRFESMKGKKHPNDETAVSTYENKIKAHKLQLDAADKELATLNK